MPHIESIFIERLKREQAQHASEALSKPKKKTSYGYGEASGVYLGLLRAEQLFLEVIGEEDDRTGRKGK